MTVFEFFLGTENFSRTEFQTSSSPHTFATVPANEFWVVFANRTANHVYAQSNQSAVSGPGAVLLVPGETLEVLYNGGGGFRYFFYGPDVSAAVYNGTISSITSLTIPARSQFGLLNGNVGMAWTAYKFSTAL